MLTVTPADVGGGGKKEGDGFQSGAASFLLLFCTVLFLYCF